jgi:hypothetical protein
VVKHVYAAELRVVVAAILAVATDAVLVAHNLPRHGAHLVAALLHAQNLELESEVLFCLLATEARKKKPKAGRLR